VVLLFLKRSLLPESIPIDRADFLRRHLDVTILYSVRVQDLVVCQVSALLLEEKGTMARNCFEIVTTCLLRSLGASSQLLVRSVKDEEVPLGLFDDLLMALVACHSM